MPPSTAFHLLTDPMNCMCHLRHLLVSPHRHLAKALTLRNIALFSNVQIEEDLCSTMLKPVTSHGRRKRTSKSLDPGNESIIGKIFLDAIRSKARGRKGIKRLKISLSSMQHTPVVSVARSTSRMKRSSGRKFPNIHENVMTQSLQGKVYNNTYDYLI